MMSLKRKFDLAVLGGGPGGYPAAIKAAQAGLSVVLIEAGLLGGTCLNWGCIPTKSLIASAKPVSELEKAIKRGILQGSFSIDFAKMQEQMDQVVTTMRQQLKTLIEAHGVTIVSGYGRFLSPNEIKVSGDSPCLIEAKNTIIATGSKPRSIAQFPFDHEKVLSSDSILSLKKLPKRLAIIGGGVIGCEFASLYQTLGVEVSVLEAMDRLIPMECPTLSEALAASFKTRGIAVKTSVRVEGIDRSSEGLSVRLAGANPIAADLALVAVGRSLNSNDIGLEKAGVFADSRGAIGVNDAMQTSVPGIYAIGDVTAKFMLAHVATHQGLIAVDHILGHDVQMNYRAIPSVIFTQPELASVGSSLEQAKKEGKDAYVGAFPFQALGKAQASYSADGFAQIVVDRKTQEILGAQVAGLDAATLIAEMGLAIANELTLESITDTVHAHPTMAEAWVESAFMAQGLPLHLPPMNRKKTLK
ncbi:MAG: lpdA1 [Chlamydiales bacterium]|jgi:dihydrolipoamide dehydrogenase|nr:lpdA1 [Chlamydiales bacterium]